MQTQIDLGAMTATLTRKPIKNVYLRVEPAAGEVHISAPRRMSLAQIRSFALSRLAWIEREQARLLAERRLMARDYVSGENLHVWGRPRRLEVARASRAPSIELTPGAMLLTVRPGTCAAKRQAIVEVWLREQVKRAAGPLIARWEPQVGVEVQWLHVQRMKTRWGTCNPASRTIRLNSELARRAPEYLEYVIVHELVHLLEPGHGERFKSLMDGFLPGWRDRRTGLRRGA